MVKNTIVKNNALIEASYRFTLTEMQIVLYGISLINPIQKDFPLSYRIDINKFSNLFDRKHGQIYQEIKEAVLKRFWERDFSYQKKDGKIVTLRWLTKVVHEDKSGYLEIKFSEEVQPYLHQLKKRFTTYYIDKITNFKSIYSIRFYEIAIMYLNKSQKRKCNFLLSLNDIKNRLDLGGKYKRFSHFKERVLEPAKKEICKHSDLNLSYKVIKLGRSAHEIEFTVSRKNQDTKTTEKTAQTRPKTRTMERAKEIAKEAGTGWDIYEIEQQFYEYIKKKGRPENMDSALIGFVRKKVKKRP